MKVPVNKWGYHTPRLKRDYRNKKWSADKAEDPEGIERSCQWCNQPLHYVGEDHSSVYYACDGYLWRGERWEPCPNNLDEHKRHHWRPSRSDVEATEHLRYLSDSWRLSLPKPAIRQF